MMKSNNVTYLVKKGISSVWKNFIMSFASFSIMLVSLLQVSITVLLMLNVNIVMGNIEDTNEAVVYVQEDATDEQVQHIKQVLENNDNLSEVVYYSKEQALNDFKEDMGEYSELFEYLEDNPMPETFLVRVKDLSKIHQTAEAIRSIDAVQQVKVSSEFASALINIRRTFSIIAIGMLAVLILVSLVIISNTIRTSVFARRNEIQIMKYVGATNSFIKLPFFVEGMFVGILSGAAAWGLTWFIYDSIYPLFTENAALWQMFGFFNLISFDSISIIVLLTNCAAGALLGAVGTTISMGKYLKV